METAQVSDRINELQQGWATYKLSVVIPAYNEEDGIAEIIDRVLSIQPQSGSGRRGRPGIDRRRRRQQRSHRRNRTRLQPMCD